MYALGTKFGSPPSRWLGLEDLAAFFFDLQVLQIGLEEEGRQHREAERRARMRARR